MVAASSVVVRSWSPLVIQGGEVLPEGAGVLPWEGMGDEVQHLTQLLWIRAAFSDSAAVVRVPEAVHRIADEQVPRVQRLSGGARPEPGAFELGEARPASW